MAELVTRWDLDKTYLRSEFSSLKDLLKSALERPDQKRPVPGAASVLRHLGARAAQVHILSGSPRQLRRSLVTRLRMDGVQFDRLTLKPNAQNLARLRFAALKDQLGYKLAALLDAKIAEGPLFKGDIIEVLVGDDSEADAFVYSLYADVAKGLVNLATLDQVLTAGATYPDVRNHILDRASELRGLSAHTRFIILIHLDRQTPPSRFAAFGPRLVPFHNYIQAALLLLHERLFDTRDFHEVCLEMSLEHGMTPKVIAASYRDLLRRVPLPPFDPRTLEPVPEEASDALGELLPRLLEVSSTSCKNFTHNGTVVPNYVELARLHRGGRNRR